MSTRASRSDLARLRLERHGLAKDGLNGPQAVVERLLAVQAQDYAAARWALAARSPGSTEADVVAAINSGAIVRSWPMRGTLHFVPPRELNWMLELTTPRLLAAFRGRRDQLGLDEHTEERAREVALEALSGGRELTRPQFLEVLESKGIVTESQRGYHLIGYLAQTGILCWGRHVGTQQALVLLDEWVPRPRVLERDEALGEFVLRYFDGHGPATLKDFAWWSHLTMKDARVGLAVAGDQLSEIDVAGVTHYLAASADRGELGARPRQRVPVLALPAFDEYLLGYQDRGVAIDDERTQLVIPGKNGVFMPLLLINGRVAGTWRKHSSPRGVVVEPRPFAELSSRQFAGLESSIRRYGAFLGRPASVVSPLG